MRSSSGCCPRLGKPLGFQPVFACVSKSLEESLTRMSFRVLRVIRGFFGVSVKVKVKVKVIQYSVKL